MRTGSNHEYQEAKRAVRQAYQDYYGKSPVLFKGDMEQHQLFIKDVANRYAVTERTIRRWLKAKVRA